MTKTTHFKLENRVNATLHAAEDQLMKQLLKTCPPRGFFKPSLMFVVEIPVKGEKMYVIYWGGFLTPKYVVQELKSHLQYALGYNFAISYKGILHSITTSTNNLLVQAIIHNEKPNLAPLLYEQNSTGWWEKYVQENTA
jgi:hypothetical protein